MQFPTLVAMVHGLALFDKVPRFQTIHAQLVGLQCRQHLVMREGLEVCAHIQWVFLAEGRVNIGIVCVSGERFGA